MKARPSLNARVKDRRPLFEVWLRASVSGLKAAK